MKKPNNYLMFFKLLLVVLAFVMNSNYLYSQCVSCDGTETSGLFPSAIGRYTKATANYSFAGGIYSEANGSASFAFGNRAFAHGGSSAAIGQFVRINTSTAMVFGAGFDINNPLINDETHSLMIGFGSTKPTLFVGMSVGVNNTGRIGIGNVTSPQSKLHLLADVNEIAELRLEHRTSGTAQYARLLMGTHTIRAGNNENMVFTTPNTSRHFVFTNGRVGIGTTSPQQPLHVVGNALVTGNVLVNSVATITNTRLGRFANGSASQPAYSFSANTSTGLYLASTNNLALSTNGVERIRITSTGDVAIGTTDPKGYKLAVKGKMIAEEVVVKMSGSWPDYVFRNDYQLMTVHEVESFIETHGHLPEVPKAQLIAESGISLGALNTVLVKKVEELTLYIIQQQKEIDVLKLKMASIANQ